MGPGGCGLTTSFLEDPIQPSARGLLVQNQIPRHPHPPTLGLIHRISRVGTQISNLWLSQTQVWREAGATLKGLWAGEVAALWSPHSPKGLPSPLSSRRWLCVATHPPSPARLGFRCECGPVSSSHGVSCPTLHSHDEFLIECRTSPSCCVKCINETVNRQRPHESC